MKFNKDGEVDFQLDKILNRGILFTDNMDGAFLEFRSTGETERLSHGLGRVPLGFLVIFASGELKLWANEKELNDWTNEDIYIQTNVPGLLARIFVL